MWRSKSVTTTKVKDRFDVNIILAVEAKQELKRKLEELLKEKEIQYLTPEEYTAAVITLKAPK